MALTEMLLLCALGLIVAFLSIVTSKKRRLDSFVRKIPSPPSLPFIGHLHWALKCRSTADFFYNIHAIMKYGNVVKMWNLHRLVFFVSDIQIIDTILTRPDEIEKGELYRFFSGNIGGIFTATREKWHPMRKALNLTFNPKLMDGYVLSFNKHAAKLLDILEKQENEAFNPRPYLARCLIDTIIETHFGVESNEQILNKGKLHEGLSKRTENVMLRFTKIWLYPNIIYKRTSFYLEDQKAKAQLSKYMHEVVKKCLLRIDSASNEKYNVKRLKYFIDMLVEEHKGKQEHPDLRLLKFLTSDILIAGYDTTASTLSHLLFNLAVHPDIQEKVHNEIDWVFKGREHSELEKQDLIKLIYLDMVIKDVVRLYCAPVISRHLENNLETERGTLPAGSDVVICIHTIHRDKQYWEHPNQLYPEHFLPEKVAARPKHAFLAFSAGPRNCPGQLYSNLATKVIAALILRKYKIESDISPENINYKMQLNMEPVNGYSVRLIPRTQ